MSKTNPIRCFAVASPTATSAYLSITENDGTCRRYDLSLTQLELMAMDAVNKADRWRRELLSQESANPTALS